MRYLLPELTPAMLVEIADMFVPSVTTRLAFQFWNSQFKRVLVLQYRIDIPPLALPTHTHGVKAPP